MPPPVAPELPTPTRARLSGSVSPPPLTPAPLRRPDHPAPLPPLTPPTRKSEEPLLTDCPQPAAGQQSGTADPAPIPLPGGRQDVIVAGEVRHATIDPVA